MVCSTTTLGKGFQVGKRLLIVCDGKTLHDDEVDEITWTDTADGVSIVGKHIRKSVRPKTTGGKGLLEMLAEGYEIYFVEDACGGTSRSAHDMAIQRITQAGAVPLTWQQTLLEWQRDWARQETYAATTGIAKEHGGAYGMGIDYAKSMFGGHEGR